MSCLSVQTGFCPALVRRVYVFVLRLISLDDVFYCPCEALCSVKTLFTHLPKLYRKISCLRQLWPGAQPDGFKSTLPVVEGKRETLAVLLLVVITTSSEEHEEPVGTEARCVELPSPLGLSVC